MGKVCYGRTTSPQAIRAKTQRSQAMRAAMSRELGCGVKPVGRWRQRQTLEDRKTRPTVCA